MGIVKFSRELGEKLSLPSYRLRILLEDIKTWKLDTSQSNRKQYPCHNKKKQVKIRVEEVSR